MDDRAEIGTGIVVSLLAVSIGLVAHFRSELWPSSHRAPAPAVPEGILPPEAFRIGVPAFGPPATAAELAVVAPLVVGAMLDDWLVEGIDAVTDGAIVVHLLRGESRLSLDIALTEGGTALAPASAGPYSIFATHLVGEHARGTVAASLAESLARVLQHNLGAAPPAGMRPYVPQHDPSDEAGPLPADE